MGEVLKPAYIRLPATPELQEVFDRADAYQRMIGHSNSADAAVLRELALNSQIEPLLQQQGHTGAEVSAAVSELRGPDVAPGMHTMGRLDFHPVYRKTTSGIRASISPAMVGAALECIKRGGETEGISPHDLAAAYADLRLPVAQTIFDKVGIDPNILARDLRREAWSGRAHINTAVTPLQLLRTEPIPLSRSFSHN